MQLHELQREHPNKRAKRVGRGGRRGKTSGRGHKGQRARAGTRVRPEVRDTIKQIPKKRGYRFQGRLDSNAVGVNLSTLSQRFESGETVAPRALVARGVVTKKAGRIPPVKVLAGGEAPKKISVSGCGVSAAAREKIEAAGGTVEE